ncbi:efflux RND transporter permease subunit [Carboxylicivirga taeanensis]|uniref:efflux RND transporter permease subunit n=1 Tax=Carboxylicivirga taeanensis TaxID=1416875 RepID=UPI003F6E11D1
MAIYSAAVKKPVTTVMIFVAVILFGFYSLKYLPIDMYPEVDPPYVTIMTVYAGANAEEIETNITKTIEDGLNSVDDLEEISSVSRDNMSIVTLEFSWEIDITEAMNNVRDALDPVKDQLPDGCDTPLLFRMSTSMMPVLFYAVSADESFSGLEKIIDEKLINTLNRVDGIGSVSVLGAPGRRIYVDCDPQKLEAYGLSTAQIGQVIAAENLNMPSGHIKMGNFDYQLRIEGEFRSSDIIENLVVSRVNGKTIKIKDVAVVKDKGREVEMINRFKGSDGMRLMVMKQSGANTVAVGNEVKRVVEATAGDLPPDVKFHLLYDSSNDIQKSINNLSQTFMFALIFVVMVVLLFLGRWRATFIIALTIPISLIMAFIYLYVSGGSINVISLSSLSIAIGMVVDDAIVVLENIIKHIERGSSPREAAIYATKEVWLSVIATTLVVVAVFFPLTLVGGQPGVLFKQLGWIVTITVVTSTLAAVTLTPMLSAKMLRLREKVNGKTSWYDRTVIPVLDKIDELYGSVVRWSISHKKVIIPAMLLVFVGTMLLARFVKFENMPEQDLGMMTINFECQTGTRVEKTNEVAEEVESYILNEMEDELKMTFISSGSDEDGGISAIFGASGSHVVEMRVKLVDLADRERSIWELADLIRSKMASMPEIVSYNVSTQSQGMSASNTVDVEIYGYDFQTTTTFANQVAERLKTLEGADDISISREREKPQLQVLFDQDKLAEYGLTTASASTAVNYAMRGLTASKFREEGEEYDIVVRYNDANRTSIADIENISIQSPLTGSLIKLTEIGHVEEYWATPTIERKTRQRIVTVSAAPAKGKVLSDVAAAVTTELEDIDIPNNVSIEIGGAYKDMQENNADLGLLFLIIVMLVFVVMASQFESLAMPLIIMTSIIFSFSGVIIALLLTNTTASMVAILGAILLVGIVVKNGIVMIDFINLLRERGIELHEAVVTACKSRLRPILMTAMTTVLGMLPMALSVGEGSEMWAPMGITVIGGLLFSTIITLIIIPSVYVLMAVKGSRNKKAQVYKKFKFLDK